jgi:hypothetical protein
MDELTDPDLVKYVRLTQDHLFLDPVVIPYINPENVNQLEGWFLRALNELLNKMLQFEPCHVVTVHDAFRVHPKDGDTVRYWYKEILAELADSEMVSCILSQIFGKPVGFTKLGDIADLIRGSNYGLS